MANYFSKFVAIVNNERLKLYEKQRYWIFRKYY
jgi:hypothetical protein